MGSAFGPGLLIVLLPAFVFLALAALLLRKGVRSRRAGTTPYCAKCAYNLTGLSSDRCPECGESLIAGNVVYGEPYQRTSGIVLGFLSLAIAAALFYATAYHVDWYRLRPSGWLISDVAARGAGAGRAWNELARRDRAGGLSASKRSRLIELCLKEQAAPATGPLTSTMIDYLGQACLAGQLSTAQQERFLHQIVSLNLRIRPRIVLGDTLPYEIGEKSRGPSSGYWLNMEPLDPTVDGKKLQKAGSMSTQSICGNSSGSMSSSLDIKDAAGPGRHRITTNVRIGVYAGKNLDRNTSQLLGVHECPQAAEVEILPAAPPDYIKHNADPAQAQDLQSRIKPQDLRLDTRSGLGFQGTLVVDSPPVPIAFDVFLRVDGKEYNVGSIYKEAHSSTHWGVSHFWRQGSDEPAPKPFTSCDVILRGSEKVARGTVDLFEYWDGELVYKDVPVMVVGTASQPTASAGQ